MQHGGENASFFNFKSQNAHFATRYFSHNPFHSCKMFDLEYINENVPGYVKP